jgi:hypothetical protein
MAYLLDANVFIQAKNLHYGLDFCPAFWDWLIEANAAGKVLSIEKVGDEIDAGADELASWAAARGTGFFVKPDATLLPALASLSAWATGQGYEPAAVNTFLQIADYYLVAHALAHRHTVVTHEVAAPSARKIKIPNACLGVGVKCMTPFEMLRHERALSLSKGGGRAIRLACREHIVAALAHGEPIPPHSMDVGRVFPGLSLSKADPASPKAHHSATGRNVPTEILRAESGHIPLVEAGS